MIELGRGMIFPDSWAYGEPPGYQVDTVPCPQCGEDRWAADESCPHCEDECERPHRSTWGPGLPYDEEAGW